MVVLQSLMGVQALVARRARGHPRGALLGALRARGRARPQQHLRETRPASRSCSRWWVPRSPNAVSLNSTMVNAARAVGPAVAGLLIATVGEGVCFLVNAVSFRRRRLFARFHGQERAQAKRTDATRERSAARRVPIRGKGAAPRYTLLMMAIVGTLGLRVPGDLARCRQADLSRWPGDLRVPDRLHGHRPAGCSGPRDRGAWSNRAADPHARRLVVRARGSSSPRSHRCWRSSSSPWLLSAGGGVPFSPTGQLDAATGGGAVHARPGDGAVGRGVFSARPRSEVR